jgi:exosome complex RNA-binding protein Csl4
MGLTIVVREMDMRCPNCNSTNLKKVSLAYE